MTPHHLKVLFFIGLSSLFMAATCNKDDDKPEPEEKGMTDFDLRGSNGKSWTISQVDRTYYNANGAVDSTTTREWVSLDERMWFGTDTNSSHEKNVYFCMFPLNEYIPQNGLWNLGANGRELTFTCDGYGIVCTTEKDGTWKIVHFGKSAYGSSFNIERTLSLANNRKVKVAARIYSDY